jgi:hypothetical protein
MKYIGQRESPFKVRFLEHLRDFKYRNGKSRFAQHLIDNVHTMGQLENIMDTLRITRKGQMTDTLEKYYIFRETKLNNQINDKLKVKQNAIFVTIVRYDHHRGLPESYTQDRPKPVSVIQSRHSSSQR